MNPTFGQATIIPRGVHAAPVFGGTTPPADRRIELSLVIPVYNGSPTIGSLVEQIHAIFAQMSFEVVLVNDGSADASEKVCSELVERFPRTVCLVQLSRNFGEHNAVLAGLKYSSGKYVAVLDDDGQNPPEEVLRMLQTARKDKLDVVYGRYRQRKHPWPRVLGSWFNDKVANIVLNKPRHIYLSSFKVMSRIVVNEIARFSGPHPYIDGLIFRVTRNVGQIDVDHRPRQAGRSGYTFGRLFKLWLSMFLGFSSTPLQLALALGAVAAASSLLLLAGIAVDRTWISPNLSASASAVLAFVVFIAGVSLLALGMLGEYLGRVVGHQQGQPPFVVRYQLRKR